MFIGRQFSDEVFLCLGVDRVQMTSLWTPSTRLDWGYLKEGLDGRSLLFLKATMASPASLQILKS